MATPLYLGTCENGVDIQINPEWDAVFNDVTGTQIPYDRLFEGEWAVISATFTRWNEPNFAQLAARPFALDTDTRGTFGNNAIGTLMLTEGAAYPLWITFPYSAKPAMSTLPAGYHFFQAFLYGPDRRKNGTGANKISTTFIALSAYSPATGVLQLYDDTMGTLPAPD